MHLPPESHSSNSEIKAGSIYRGHRNSELYAFDMYPHPVHVEQGLLYSAVREPEFFFACRPKTGGLSVQRVKMATSANGLLTEQTRSWNFDVRPGPTGLMETARTIRPDDVSLKAYYGNMFYHFSESVAQCMFPGCFTTHAMPKGSFSNPMKHLKKFHDIVLAGNDLKVLIEAEADTQPEAQSPVSSNPFQKATANFKKASEAKLECAQNLAEMMSHGPFSHRP